MPKTLKNGAVELVQSVTYPKPAPTQKLIQCRYCPAKFENEQGHTVHRKMLHPRVNAHEGTRLLASMRGGGKAAMWPWEGLGLGRCWVARLGTGPAGANMFQLQPKRCSLDDGFSCDDGKSTGRCGAGIRRVYTNREKAAAVEKLRRFQKQEHAIFEAYRMTPLQYTSKTVGTAESNISKWAKGEALIVEKAATHVSKDLLKNFRLKPSFPLAEKELHTLFRAKRKRGLKVSTLWLCVTMAALIKKLYPDDPRAETFTPTWRFVGKWAKKWRVATRRRSNSKNQSIEERLPKIQRFHKSLRGLMKNPAPASRGSNGAGAGGGSRVAQPGAVESGGAGPGDGSGEGHAHADKKYGRFPLDQRVNVDQVRSREYFYQDILFVGVIFSLFRYATVQYAFCGLLEPTMQDFCCCHLVCFVRIAPLLEGNSRETFAKKILSFKGVL